MKICKSLRKVFKMIYRIQTTNQTQKFKNNRMKAIYYKKVKIRRVFHNHKNCKMRYKNLLIMKQFKNQKNY